MLTREQITEEAIEAWHNAQEAKRAAQAAWWSGAWQAEDRKMRELPARPPVVFNRIGKTVARTPFPSRALSDRPWSIAALVE